MSYEPHKCIICNGDLPEKNTHNSIAEISLIFGEDTTLGYTDNGFPPCTVIRNAFCLPCMENIHNHRNEVGWSWSLWNNHENFTTPEINDAVEPF